MKAKKKKKKGARKIKVGPIDILFSKCVRTRVDYKCEWSGTKFHPGDTRGLEACHIFGRAKRGLRFLPMNAVALNTGRHMYFTAHPLEFTTWVENHIGKENADKLRILAGQTYQLKQADLKEIQANLKASLEKMELERADGLQGRIEFDSPYPMGLAA